MCVCVCVNETHPAEGDGGRPAAPPPRDGGGAVAADRCRTHEDFVAAQQVDVEQEQFPSRYIDYYTTRLAVVRRLYKEEAMHTHPKLRRGEGRRGRKSTL